MPTTDEILELLVDALAEEFASRRTSGAVYMDGSHNPQPSEITDARNFMTYVFNMLGR